MSLACKHRITEGFNVQSFTFLLFTFFLYSFQILVGLLSFVRRILGQHSVELCTWKSLHLVLRRKLDCNLKNLHVMAFCGFTQQIQHIKLSQGNKENPGWQQVSRCMFRPIYFPNLNSNLRIKMNIQWPSGISLPVAILHYWRTSLLQVLLCYDTCQRIYQKHQYLPFIKKITLLFKVWDNACEIP